MTEPRTCSLALRYDNPEITRDFIETPAGLVREDLTISPAQIKKLNLGIAYFYRDAANYKTPAFVKVFDGPLSCEQIAELYQTLEDHANFIPEQVGFPNAFEQFSIDGYEFDDDDHVFNEVHDIYLTVAAPTEQVTALEILKTFQQTAEDGGWDVVSAMRKRGLV